NTNTFLTLAIRQLLPHLRLVARANCEESVAQFYPSFKCRSQNCSKSFISTKALSIHSPEMTAVS
ncbi:MAG: hypothetical protein R3302_09830, partial [Sulfurimonadaceae bacterium]|nr:hypothetical protein [Sulfurimonadaceae bacterium]